MSKYKINKNKPLPSDDKIKSHMDFNKLVGDYNKIHNYKNATKPLYKNPKFLSFIALLSTVILVFIISERENEEQTTKVQKKQDTSIVVKSNSTLDITKKVSTEGAIVNESTADSAKTNKLPEKKISNLQIPYKSYFIDAKLGSMIYRKNGTRIIIPPDCFVDKNGKKLTEKIRIDYREFKDPVDFFFSGISMNYDSAQKHFSLESAGMFEILGFVGNEQVYINKEKPIVVELLTAYKRPSFNTYFYDKQNKTWIYKGKEEALIRFTVEGDEKDYPELKPFKNMLWEFSLNSEQKNPSEYNWIFSRPWNKFFVSEIPTKADKKVELHQTKNVNFSAKPVGLLNDKEANDKLIKSKFDEYYSLSAKKKAAEKKLLQEALERQAAFEKSDFGKAYSAWSQTVEGKKQIMASKVTNIFTVDNFGIYSCDRPEKYPKGASLQAIFTDENNKPLALDKMMLVDYELNSIFYLDNLKSKSLIFNPKSSNIIWEILPANKLAVYSMDKFRAIKQTSGTFTFRLKIIDLNGKNLDDVRKELGIKTKPIKEEDRNSNYDYIKPNRTSDFERIIKMKKQVEANETYFLKSDLDLEKEKMQRKIIEKQKEKDDIYKYELPE